MSARGGHPDNSDNESETTGNSAERIPPSPHSQPSPHGKPGVKYGSIRQQSPKSAAAATTFGASVNPNFSGGSKSGVTYNPLVKGSLPGEEVQYSGVSRKPFEGPSNGNGTGSLSYQASAGGAGVSPLGHDDHEKELIFEDDARLANRSLRTGRQRKKLAARSKGGEFQARRRKRRVYFACICSEIDIPKLHEYLASAEELFFRGWVFKVYGDVLHMFKPGVSLPAEVLPETAPGAMNLNSTLYMPSQSSMGIGQGSSNGNLVDNVALQRNVSMESGLSAPSGQQSSYENSTERVGGDNAYASDSEMYRRRGGAGGAGSMDNADIGMGMGMGGDATYTDNLRISAVGAQEVFVFDFGAAVFWSFSRGEEARIIKAIRMFVTKGSVLGSEFESGEDDMAFVTAPDVDAMTVANDMITLPENSLVKQRLSASFAIAQSTVLAIFESRIETKIEEYKYIPETLAACGKVQLSQRQLGTMIGEVFVIRHDVNLHSEILDTPDFFWKEEKYLLDYRMMFDYLEMKSRTDVSNTRLDMLRELLDVLQQQMENAHAVKLEWIVIWLIVTEVVLQMVAVFSPHAE